MPTKPEIVTIWPFTHSLPAPTLRFDLFKSDSDWLKQWGSVFSHKTGSPEGGQPVSRVPVSTVHVIGTEGLLVSELPSLGCWLCRQGTSLYGLQVAAATLGTISRCNNIQRKKKTLSLPLVPLGTNSETFVWNLLPFSKAGHVLWPELGQMPISKPVTSKRNSITMTKCHWSKCLCKSIF